MAGISVNPDPHPDLATLIERHRPLVVAACRRQLADPADVEDAVQQTFIKLAQHLGDIHTSTAAWLHRTATRTCLDLRRRRATRRKHEAQAAQLRTQHQPSLPGVDLAAWNELQAHVDAALDALPDHQRGLIADHFFAGQSQRELAKLAGVSASTVNHRLKQAIQGLRAQLQRRGVQTPAATLLAALPALSVRALDVPAALSVAALTTTAASSIGTTTAGVSVGTASGVVGTSIVAKLAAAPLLTGAAGLFVAASVAVVAAVSIPRDSDASPNGPELQALAAVYALDEHTPAGFFPPPFPPERDAFFEASMPWREQGAQGIDWLALRKDAERGPRYGGTSFPGDPNVREVLETAFDIPPRQLENLDRLDWTPGPGDWVLRTHDGMTTKQKLDAFAFVFMKHTGRPLTFESRTVVRPHLVICRKPDRGPRDAQGNFVGVYTETPITQEQHEALVRRLDAWNADPTQENINALRLGDTWFNPNIGSDSVWEQLDVPVFRPRTTQDPTLILGDLMYETRFLMPLDDPDKYFDHTRPGYRDRLENIVNILQDQLGGQWELQDRELTIWSPVVEPWPASTLPRDADHVIAADPRYELPEGRDVGFVGPPFRSERWGVWSGTRTAGARETDRPTAMTFYWHGPGRLALRSRGYATGASASEVLDRQLAFPSYALDRRRIDAAFDGAVPVGDFVFRRNPSGMTMAQRLEAFAQAVRERFGRRVVFEARPERRLCVVLREPPDRGVRTDGDRIIAAVSSRLPSTRELDAMRSAYDVPGWQGVNHEAVSAMLDAPVLGPAGDLIPDRPDALIPGSLLFWDLRFWVPRAGDPTDTISLDRRAAGYRARLERIVRNLETQVGGRWEVQQRTIDVWHARVAGADE